jgi:hypothetical protein
MASGAIAASVSAVSRAGRSACRGSASDKAAASPLSRRTFSRLSKALAPFRGSAAALVPIDCWLVASDFVQIPNLCVGKDGAWAVVAYIHAWSPQGRDGEPGAARGMLDERCARGESTLGLTSR